jgi:hypothetical protein
MEKWKSFTSAFPPWSWVTCPKQPWVASHDVSVAINSFSILDVAQEEHDELSCPQNEETSCSEKEEPIDIATLVCLLTDILVFDSFV